MKRILCWIGTIGALFLLWGCVEGMNNAALPDLEGGSEAGNPPSGDRPVADSNPDGERDKDHCEKGEEPPDCLGEGRENTGPLYVPVPPKEVIEKIASTDDEAEPTEEPVLKIRPETLEHFQELLKEQEPDDE